VLARNWRNAKGVVDRESCRLWSRKVTTWVGKWKIGGSGPSAGSLGTYRDGPTEWWLRQRSMAVSNGQSGDHQWDDRKDTARLARQSAVALYWRRHQATVTDLRWETSCRARVRRGTRCGVVALVPLGDLVGDDLRVTDGGSG